MGKNIDRRRDDRRSHERRAEDRKKKRFDWKILIIVAIIGAIVFLWLRINRQEEEAVRETAVPVRVIYPEKGSILRTLTVSGYVESENMVTVLPKISGTLTTLKVDMGDRVAEGEVIATIDSEPYKLSLRQAEAALYAAESTFERMKQLYQANATSKQNFDQAKSQYDAAQSQYDLAVLNYQYTQIESPLSGVVLQKHSTVGSLVASQVPIVTIGDLENLIIKGKVPEKHYAFFFKNRNTLDIEADLPALEGEKVPASIRTLSPYISPETKTFQVVCTLGPGSGLIRPGMFLELSFILDRRDGVYRLPFETLVGGAELWWVDPTDCRARMLEFEPQFHNNRVFEIPPEMKARPFMVEGQHFISEGRKCRVLNEPELCGGEDSVAEKTE